MNDLLGKTFVNPIFGDVATYIHTANETNGEKTVLEIKLQPGGGNPLHYHTAFEETFEQLSVTLGHLNAESRKEIMTST